MKIKTMKKSAMAAIVMLGLVIAPVAATVALAQDPAPAADSALVDTKTGKAVDGKPDETKKGG